MQPSRHGAGVAPEANQLAEDGDLSNRGGERDQILNDITNTGVMGALVCGFALSNLQKDAPAGGWTAEGLDLAIYMPSFEGVHACTCSAITSALLYRQANALDGDREAVVWRQAHPMLLSLPMMKFGMGCVSYLTSVILLSWQALAASALWQYLALFIGVTSVSMTVGTAVVLLQDGKT